jgi:4'-phosphopantetheinyl transferase
MANYLNNIWQQPPLNLNLNLNEIHVWLLDLNLDLHKVDQLSNILSEDELTRAKKFHFEHHQHRFIITRANLRFILSKYLKITAQEIEFIYSEKGKPSLVKTCNQEGIEFNLSHTDNLALYAFTKNQKIGVDLEKIKDNCDIENLAKRFFTNNEYQVISNLERKQQPQAFFQAWTSKEAYLKATGEGLGGGLENIEINLHSQERELVRIEGNKQLVENWTLEKIDINDDYIATLAVKNLKKEIMLHYFCNNYGQSA